MTKQETLELYSGPQEGDSGQRLLRHNLRSAERTLGHAPSPRLESSIRSITEEFGFSLDRGELMILNGSAYVTHTGLLHLGRRMNCSGIAVETIDSLCDAAARRFVVKATVFSCPGSPGFAGYGDADPSNVSAVVRGAELRIAETRAVNRALRKAYGVGLCSAEELGALPPRMELAEHASASPEAASGRSGRRVRDRLRQIIRRHKLDPALVKAYAVDCCGSPSLKQASREQIENFVEQLAEEAARDRSRLLCQLNGYARPTPEVIV